MSRPLHALAAERYKELRRVTRSLGAVGDLTAHEHIRHMGMNQLLDVAEAVVELGASDPSLTERAREAVLQATGRWIP